MITANNNQRNLHVHIYEMGEKLNSIVHYPDVHQV